MRVVNGKLVKDTEPKMDLLNLFFELGDTPRAQDLVAQVMDQVCDTMLTNKANLVRNWQAGKTTRAEGIKIGVDPKDLRDVADYHVSVDTPLWLDCITEYQTRRRLDPQAQIWRPAVIAFGDSRTVTPSLVFEGSACAMVVAHWPHGTIIRFIANSITRKRDFTGDHSVDQFVKDLM